MPTFEGLSRSIEIVRGLKANDFKRNCFKPLNVPTAIDFFIESGPIGSPYDVTTALSVETSHVTPSLEKEYAIKLVNVGISSMLNLLMLLNLVTPETGSVVMGDMNTFPR